MYFPGAVLWGSFVSVFFISVVVNWMGAELFWIIYQKDSDTHVMFLLNIIEQN